MAGVAHHAEALAGGSTSGGPILSGPAGTVPRLVKASRGPEGAYGHVPEAGVDGSAGSPEPRRLQGRGGHVGGAARTPGGRRGTRGDPGWRAAGGRGPGQDRGVDFLVTAAMAFRAYGGAVKGVPRAAPAGPVKRASKDVREGG